MQVNGRVDAHTCINATSILAVTAHVLDPFRYSQLLGEDKTRCLGRWKVPAVGTDIGEQGPPSGHMEVVTGRGEH